MERLDLAYRNGGSQARKIIPVERQQLFCAGFLGRHGVHEIVNATATDAFGPCHFECGYNFGRREIDKVQFGNQRFYESRGAIGIRAHG